MAKAENIKQYNSFVRGLITEAGPLTFPENASLDEVNCLLNRDGSRQRRLGIDYELNGILSTATVTDTDISEDAIVTGRWSSVGGNGNTNFLVLQLSNTLHFYDLAIDPLSTGKKSFTIDLSTYAAPGATDVGSEPCSFASGKGFLFVNSKKIDPIYIEYDSGLDSISTTQYDIEIRDMDGLEDNLNPDEEPTSLSDAHKYNLRNQGWVIANAAAADPITTYRTSNAPYYPPNSKQVFWARSTTGLNPTVLANFFGGNTLAPKGHYILEAFYKDRATVSGIGGLAVESEDNRPSTVAFYAGRVFYSGVASSKVNGHIWYTQIIENEKKIGRCYQEADPTSENISDLVATDGGVVVIPDIGNTLYMFALQDALIVFADNGIWSISGTDGGFKATDYKVEKVASIGALSRFSIVDVDGLPLWWNQTGIYGLSKDETSLRPVPKNLTESTIQTFYNDIPALSKESAQGIYDPATRRVQWFYRSTAPTSSLYRFKYDRVLNFDLVLKAFYPWEIQTITGETPYIAGAFTTSSLNDIVSDQNVVAANVLVEASATQVTAGEALTLGSDTFVKYLTIVPSTSASTNKWTFSLFRNQDFLDWEGFDNTGVDAAAYVETGYELAGDFVRQKQSPYIITLFNRTETEYVFVDGQYEYDFPSSCYMTAKWSWTDSGNSGKWSDRVQVYRLIPSFPLDVNNLTYTGGHTVVTTKNKIRGTGKALHIKFESEEGKDFQLLGWGTVFTGKTRP